MRLRLFANMAQKQLTSSHQDNRTASDKFLDWFHGMDLQTPFPNLHAFLYAALTTGASSATCIATFSAVTRLLTPYRRCMTHERKKLLHSSFLMWWNRFDEQIYVYLYEYLAMRDGGCTCVWDYDFVKIKHYDCFIKITLNEPYSVMPMLFLSFIGHKLEIVPRKEYENNHNDTNSLIQSLSTWAIWPPWGPWEIFRGHRTKLGKWGATGGHRGPQNFLSLRCSYKLNIFIFVLCCFLVRCSTASFSDFSVFLL